ncbi:BspA family leucine-rich repeat surface protein [Helicobacter sp. T3_23-1059]
MESQNPKLQKLLKTIDRNDKGQFVPNNQQIKELVRYDEVKLGGIDTSKVTSFRELFKSSSRVDFSGISSWDTSRVTTFMSCFEGAESFNENINDWNVSNATNFMQMFYGAKFFNQPLDKWDTAKATNTIRMFLMAVEFNQPIQSWNMSNVIWAWEMFAGAEKFNQPLNDWDMSSVQKIQKMFLRAKDFNQPLDKWNISNVVDMQGVFSGAESFNQDLSEWGTKLGKVKSMARMFADTKSLDINFLQDWQIPADCYTDNIIKGSKLQLEITQISDSGAEIEKETLQDSSQNAIDSVKQAYQLASDIKEFRIYQIVKNDKNLIDKDYKNALDSFVNPQEWQKCDRKELYSWLPKNIRQSFEIYLSKKQGDRYCKADESKWDFICYKVFDYIFVIEVGDKENILNISQNALKKHDKRTLTIKQEPFDDDDEDYDFGERKIHYQSNSLHISLEDSNEMYIYNGNTNKDTQNSNRILNIIGALILAKAYESKMYDFNKMARSTKGANLMQCHKEICAFDLKFYQDTPVLVYNSALVEFWEKLSKRYKINDKHKELQETITRIAQLVSDEIRERENKTREAENKRFTWAMFIIGVLSALGAILAAVPVIQSMI